MTSAANGGPEAVEHERCQACGFDGAAFDDPGLLAALRSLGPRWAAKLGDAGDDLRRRPHPEVWSAIEYAAHSRDVTALHVFGVEQALTGTEPDFGEVAGDELIAEAARSYGDLDPAQVAGELAAEAERLAGAADDAGSQCWDRGLTIGGSRQDVRRLLEHALHDSEHHLVDVDRGLAGLRG